MGTETRGTVFTWINATETTETCRLENEKLPPAPQEFIDEMKRNPLKYKKYFYLPVSPKNYGSVKL
jgi:hypothetical protein